MPRKRRPLSRAVEFLSRPCLPSPLPQKHELVGKTGSNARNCRPLPPLHQYLGACLQQFQGTTRRAVISLPDHALPPPTCLLPILFVLFGRKVPAKGKAEYTIEFFPLAMTSSSPPPTDGNDPGSRATAPVSAAAGGGRKQQQDTSKDTSKVVIFSFFLGAACGRRISEMLHRPARTCGISYDTVACICRLFGTGEKLNAGT